MLVVDLVQVPGSLGAVRQTHIWIDPLENLSLVNLLWSKIMGAIAHRALPSAYASPADQPWRSQSYLCNLEGRT